MSDKPLVSVLMGAYNCSATLGASLDSILSQDYPNLEVIVCDDGSRDGTAEVILRYAEKDPRVVALRNETNIGLSRTLNRCARVARGAYFARMDGDDISRSDRIGRQVEFLESNHEYGFCGSSISLFDSAGVWGRLDYPESPQARDFLLRSPFAHPSVMFRAECLLDSGGYDEDPAIGRSEDYDLFMRLFAAGVRGYNVQDLLFNYREELGSFRKRKLRYAFTEARVRLRGFRRLGLLPLGLPYALKPLMVAFVPRGLYAKLRKKIFGGSRHDSRHSR